MVCSALYLPFIIAVIGFIMASSGLPTDTFLFLLSSNVSTHETAMAAYSLAY